MIRFSDAQERRDKKIDFMDPWFQDAPVARAILTLLRKLTDRFRGLPQETTDLDWTAFRALAKAGAAEGIIRSTCTYADSDGPCTEYFHVRGDYPDAMPPRLMLTSEPIEHVLVRARLTTIGIQWAEYLAAENTQYADKIRGFVLQLLWQAKVAQGHVRQVPNPKGTEATEEASMDAVTDYHGVEPDESRPGQAVERRREQDVADDEEQFGGPEEDPFDPRVVSWLGKRLYLGHDTQISRLFWLLAKKPGVPHTLGEVQRAVDGVETYRDEHGEDAFRKSMNHIAKALSKLRKHLRENDLDDHVIILKEGPSDSPSYTMIARFG